MTLLRHTPAGEAVERQALTINPAKTCQPIGAMYAALGIHRCLPHSHGSQGCCAYHRSTLTRHYKEPVMAATSSFMEGSSVFGGQANLVQAIHNIFTVYDPDVIAVHTTCLSETIGDDVEAICKRVASENGIPVLAVHSEGFKGTKKDGYKAACAALFKLVGSGSTEGVSPHSINIVGDFNLAGETWMIRKYYERLGVQVVATITGDGRVDDIRRSHAAALNVVQCSGSMIHLAKMMEQAFAVPCIRVSYFGIEDMSKALYDVADFFGDAEIKRRAQDVVREEVARIMPEVRRYRRDLEGRRAAVYVGGAFKAFSLVRSLRTLGMKTVLAGSQTGNHDDYRLLGEQCDEGTVLVDDTNPVELSKFVRELNVDLFIGGVKERPLAYKLGVAFCDHNHERKEALAGFEGMLNFAREVHSSVMSPVWKLGIRDQGLGIRD